MKRSKTPGFSLAVARREREGRARYEAELAEAVRQTFAQLQTKGALVLDPNIGLAEGEDYSDFERRRSRMNRLVRGVKDACRAAGRRFMFATSNQGVVTFAVRR